MSRSAPAVTFIGFAAMIVLCFVAQQQFDAQSALGYVWLGAAGVIAFLLIAPMPQIDLSAHIAETFDFARGRRRWIGIVALVVGLAILGHSALLFHEGLLVSDNFGDAPWLQFALGLPITLVGALLLVGIGRLPRPDITMLILIGVVALALFLRTYGVDQFPLGVWYDEAAYGLDIRHLLSDPTYRPIFLSQDVIAFPHLLAYVIGYLLSNGSIAGMRAATALLATFGVIMAYLVGRELRGRWFGLLMAALLAVLHWSINPSRIAFPGADTVTFTLIAFYGGLRIVRYGRLRDALWSGLAIGVGGWFYGQYQPQVLAVGVFALLAYPFLRRRWWRTLALVMTAVLAGVIVLLPLEIYIIDRSSEYFSRLNQVSIFQEDLSGKSVTDAILRSAVLHLEMFHLRGDNNGRHNLSGAPMLDPVTGALMVIGLFLALREWRRREHLLMLLSLIIALLGGILSVSFEAPQSHRALAAIVGVIYFAALGLEGIARLALNWFAAQPDSRRQTIRRMVVGADALVVLVVIGGWNLNEYFNLERTSLDSWSSYETIQTLTGRLYASYDRTTRFYVSPLIGSEDVTIHFLAADALSRSNNLVLPDAFPLRIPAAAPAVIMLEAGESEYLDYLHRLYPNAAFTAVRPADYGVDDNPNDTLFYVVALKAADVGAIEGLQDGFGVIYAPQYDRYTFTFASGANVQIDNAPVVSGTPVELAEGNHRIAVTPADTALTWQYSGIDQVQTVPSYDLFHGAVTPNGLLASFYANGNFAGTPAAERVYPFAYQYVHVVPMNRPYSVRYDGYLYAPVTGEYQFRVRGRDSGALDIDGRNVIPATPPDQDGAAALTLTQGWHPVEVRHQDLTGYTYIYFSWLAPGGEDYEPVSRDYLCPALNLCAAPPAN